MKFCTTLEKIRENNWLCKNLFKQVDFTEVLQDIVMICIFIQDLNFFFITKLKVLVMPAFRLTESNITLRPTFFFSNPLENWRLLACQFRWHSACCGKGWLDPWTHCVHSLATMPKRPEIKTLKQSPKEVFWKQLLQCCIVREKNNRVILYYIIPNQALLMKTNVENNIKFGSGIFT